MFFVLFLLEFDMLLNQNTDDLLNKVLNAIEMNQIYESSSRLNSKKRSFLSKTNFCQTVRNRIFLFFHACTSSSFSYYAFFTTDVVAVDDGEASQYDSSQ